jgi:hypothetical protein
MLLSCQRLKQSKLISPPLLWLLGVLIAVLQSRGRSLKEPHHLVGAGAVTRYGFGSDNGTKQLSLLYSKVGAGAAGAAGAAYKFLPGAGAA